MTDVTPLQREACFGVLCSAAQVPHTSEPSPRLLWVEAVERNAYCRSASVLEYLALMQDVYDAIGLEGACLMDFPGHVICELDLFGLADGSAVVERERTEASRGETVKTLLREQTSAVSSMSNTSCYHCKSKDVIVYQRQTRSADEGATTFIACTTCGKTAKK